MNPFFFTNISNPKDIGFNLEKIDVNHETCKATVRCQMMSFGASILPYLHMTIYQTINQVLQLKTKSLARNLPWLLAIGKNAENTRNYIFYF